MGIIASIHIALDTSFFFLLQSKNETMYTFTPTAKRFTRRPRQWQIHFTCPAAPDWPHSLIMGSFMINRGDGHLNGSNLTGLLILTSQALSAAYVHFTLAWIKFSIPECIRKLLSFITCMCISNPQRGTILVAKLAGMPGHPTLSNSCLSEVIWKLPVNIILLHRKQI